MENTGRIKGTQAADTIIGIDLGTSTTEAAVIQDGKPVMLLNFENKVITQSAVGIDESGNFVVGDRARAQYLLYPERTAIEIKRKIGTQESFLLGSQSYSPIDLSARILDYVKRYASERLGSPVVRAVISVPAYFDDVQRRATIEAGRQAGLEVVRIINEPTAAALSYGLEHMEDEKHILVYDLGGGTFDVTLLEMFDGVLEVKASSGDNALGGKDFDERLVSWLADRFYEKHHVRLQDDAYAMVKLKEHAEACKLELSSQEEAVISIPFLITRDGNPLAMEETVSRSQFEELIEDLIKKTHRPVNVVLGDSGIPAEEIDMVLLVGGSTRIPVVKQDIEEFLGVKAYGALNPDYAVAEGAAIQAGIISGAVNPEDSIIMTDVNPFTLGIRTQYGFNEDYMSVVIPRNVTIPTTRMERYYTSSHFQDTAVIEVYQGEYKTATRNHFLGTFNIGGIPLRAAREESIDVEFSYDQNGILKVTACIVSTGNKASVTIDMKDAGGGPEPRVDVSKWKDAPEGKRYRAVIRRSERFLNTQSQVMNEEDREELEEMIYLLKKSLIENTETAEDLEQDILDILDDWED